MANHPKSAAPKMSQNGRKAIRTCNLPHSEAVKANDPNAWVPAHEIFLPQRFGHAEISKLHKMPKMANTVKKKNSQKCDDRDGSYILYIIYYI
jgi:hypothetical protein